jgi:hypothetical protein
VNQKADTGSGEKGYGVRRKRSGEKGEKKEKMLDKRIKSYYPLTLTIDQTTVKQVLMEGR